MDHKRCKIMKIKIKNQDQKERGERMLKREVKLLEWANAVLHNDESSSDEEIIESFVANGIAFGFANALVKQRTKCLNEMAYVAII